MAVKDITGMIFDISRFCLHDGPGIRTTVFLKGCPLQCAWCHNPEGLSPLPDLFYDVATCISCGRCVKVCKQGCHILEKGKHVYERKSCMSCGACSTVCPTGAIERAGRKATVREVLEVVERDKAYYSDGGLTLSGGEPFFQPDFALSLLEAAKKAKLNTCVETSGFCSSDVIRDSIPYVDCYLFDCKETDPSRHLAYTGVSLDPIQRNLCLLGEADCRIILRCPVIPGYNDRTDHMEGIALLVDRLPSVAGVELIPYHPLGVGKHHKLGLEPKCLQEIPLNREKIMELSTLLRELTKVPVTIEE